MDLQSPGASNVSIVMTGAGASGISRTSNAASSDVYEYIGCGYGGMSGLSISKTCGEIYLLYPLLGALYFLLAQFMVVRTPWSIVLLFMIQHPLLGFLNL